jgi:hypothetical protein
VRRPNEFYLWAQGALQGFLPHETLVCVFDAGPAGEAPVEIFSGPSWRPRPRRRCAPVRRMWATLRRHWQHLGQRPCAHPRRPRPKAPRWCMGRRSALSPCLFVFLGMPAEPGPRELYLAELLLPHLYMALVRQRHSASFAGVATGLSAPVPGAGRARGGKTNAQIASDLGISPVTVNITFSRRCGSCRS